MMNSTARSGVSIPRSLPTLQASTLPMANIIMNTMTSSNVHLHFRAPGAPLNGPIRYAIGACVQGSLLVARGRQGICAVLLDDTNQGLRTQLENAFPGIPVAEATDELQRELAEVAAFIDLSAANAPIDLDVGGTPFQQRVWAALCDIPAGQTRSYAQVARSIGAPAAIRAVAGACAANVLAIAIPCHRVLRSDGSISGYRWGVQRKRSLLQRERG